MSSESLDSLDYSDVQFQHGLQLIKNITLHHAKPGQDLGCGTGRLVSMELAHEVGTIVGVDPDKQRVAVAREKLLINKNNKRSVTFLEGYVYEAVNGVHSTAF